MATIPVIWILVALGVTGATIAGVLVVRMRRLAARRGAEEAEERARMEGRLAQVQDAPSLTPSPLTLTRPEERWVRRTFPARDPRT